MKKSVFCAIIHAFLTINIVNKLIILSMKIVRMANMKGMQVGISPEDYSYLYSRFYDKLMKLAYKYKPLFYVKHDKTIDEYNNSLDVNGRIEKYFNHGARNELEYLLWCELRAYMDNVEYAYEYMEDIQPAHIRAIETTWANSSTKKNYYNKKRKRYLDMKKVLQTYTKYIKAHKDVLKRIRYEFNN